jgi:CheY-like chemotaxis protein
LEQVKAALALAESKMQSAREQVTAARREGNPDRISHAMRVEGSIRRILYLEPHFDSGALLRALLVRFGYEITHVMTSAEAQAELSRGHHELLLAEVYGFLDTRDAIPGNSGYRLMEEAKRRHIPGIALTVLDANEGRAEIIAAGYSVHLSKPASVDEILEAIQLVASAKANVEDAQGSPPSATDPM